MLFSRNTQLSVVLWTCNHLSPLPASVPAVLSALKSCWPLLYQRNSYLFSTFWLVAISLVKPALTSVFSGRFGPKYTSVTTIITLCWISFFFTCFYHYFVNSLRKERLLCWFLCSQCSVSGPRGGRRGERRRNNKSSWHLWAAPLLSIVLSTLHRLLL